MSSYLDRLMMLKSIYGSNVLCTEGLFHIIDNNHNEIYINRNTCELDKRGKYKTLVVFDNTILAKIVKDVKTKYVLLNKVNLECVYKSSSEIRYVDNNIMYDVRGVIISHSGKKLIEFERIQSIKKIDNRHYIVYTGELFNDKLIEYIPQSDRVIDFTKNKQYSIKIDNDVLCVNNMSGGKYRYNLSKHECFNEFTMEIERDTQLWTLN